MNADEIREELAKRGISVMRKVIAGDIAVLNEYGYEVLSYSRNRNSERLHDKLTNAIQSARRISSNIFSERFLCLYRGRPDRERAAFRSVLSCVC